MASAAAPDSPRSPAPPLSPQSPDGRWSPRSDDGARSGLDGLVLKESVKKLHGVQRGEHRQLIEALERHYREELRRISPSWLVAAEGSGQPAVDVAETTGVPGAVLGAILAGKCRDQRIPATPERQKRFAEWMQSHCESLWFSLHDAGVGQECAKGIVLALALNDRFTSLNLACNSLGDAGADIIARVLPDHQTLLHLDLSANDIGYGGGNALFDALLSNRSVTYVDLSSKPGSLRNHLARYNAGGLESLLATNPVLAKLSLMGNSLGPDGAQGLARGLHANTTLLSLDLAGNDIGAKGVAAIAEALDECALEELSLSDNRCGDEGLLALAKQLGVSEDDPVRNSTRYQEAMIALRLAVSDDSGETGKREIVAKVTSATAQLALALEASPVPHPKLKVLLVSGNSASNVGVARLEDTLQSNRTLVKVALDQSDHRGEWGVRSLVTSLPVNSTLKSLSLNQCGLGTAGVVDLARALTVNQALESLSLKGNMFSVDGATALGALLELGAESLKSLNLSSCRLEDASGVAIAAGLAENSSLENLQLRDNLFRDVVGRAFADALRNQTKLIQLCLDLNSIDFRFLTQIKTLLERNARTRERARPKHFRKRIEELKECQRTVRVLTTTLKRNMLRKRKAKMKQAVAIQELKDAQQQEHHKQAALDANLRGVQQAREEVEREISELQTKLATVKSEGNHENGQLQQRIASVEDRISHHEKHIANTTKQLEQFEAAATEELDGLKAELERAEKARNSAELLALAAQRNLDSFAASLRAIEEEVAGGVDPRRRLVDGTSLRPGEGARRDGGGSARSGSRPAEKSGVARPRTPNRTAAAPKARPSSRNRGAPKAAPKGGPFRTPRAG